MASDSQRPFQVSDLSHLLMPHDAKLGHPQKAVITAMTDVACPELREETHRKGIGETALGPCTCRGLRSPSVSLTTTQRGRCGLLLTAPPSEHCGG